MIQPHAPEADHARQESRFVPGTEYTPSLLHVTSPDFYMGYQKATLDFERKYKRQIVDEEQLCLIFVRVACDQDHTDLWKTGYLAGLFAALYSVLCRWSVTYTWTLGECASDVAYAIDSKGRRS